jgi:Uma2 family endonuclease
MPRPGGLHQQILINIGGALSVMQRRQQPRSWEAIPGIGTRISDTSLPEPDIMILPAGTIRGNPYSRETRNVIVAFEVLSPSTEERDLRWKRKAYATLPSLTRYVVVAQDSMDVVVFARDAGFADRHLRSLGDSLELVSLGISLPLSEIYRDTGLE